MATGVTSSITSDISFTSHYQLTKDDDTLIISGATVTMLKPQGDIFTDAGNDTVRIEDSVIFTDQPNLAFKLGSGDDTLTVTNTTFSAPVETNGGNDVVSIAGTAQNKVRLNQELTFGAGDDLLELISMLENAGSIDFGSSGIKTLRFNGGALLPVQISGTTNYGTIGSFTNLDVTIAGGTTGSNLDLSGEQTSITLNGNLTGTANDKAVSVSGGTTTLTVGSNVRTNVHLVLNNTELIHADGAILEFSDHSGYAVTADESVVNLHDIVVKGGYGLIGSNTDWDIDNSDFSNAEYGISLTGGTLKLRTVGMANYTSTAMVLSGTSLTGSKLSLMSNVGYGAIRITSGAIEITDFRANNNRTNSGMVVSNLSSILSPQIASGGVICQNGGDMTLTSASFAGNIVSPRGNFSGFAYGGAIYQKSGNMTLTSASFAGNIASAYASAYRGGPDAVAYASAHGGAIYQSGGNMTLTSATFSGNIASTYASANTPRARSTANAYAYGGAIYQSGGNMTLTSATFSGNIAIASAYCGGQAAIATAYGGAVCLINTLANMENCIFTINSAYCGATAYGGAINLNKTTLNYVVTPGTKVTNIGNLANAGGWLYAGNQSTVNITVENESFLTIGDENGNDSIAGTSDSRITKNGIGYMLVNSYISGFVGLWTVAEGTLELARIARTLKLDDWTIGTDATLVLSVQNDTINMNMSKKVGTIDMGGGADTINTSGYNLTDGTVLLSDLTLTGGGRVSVKLRNRSTTEGSTLRLGGIYLDNEFIGNNYTDTILVTAESTLNGAIDLGNGDNEISATALATFGSTLKMGRGNDTLSFTSVSFADTVDLGDGDNSLTATGTASFVKALNAGSSNDTLTFVAVTTDGVLDLGDGDNSLTATSTAKFTKAVAMGTGNDTLSFADVTFEDTLDLGDGNNDLTITGTGKLQSIIGGSGNDTITLDSEGKISGVIDLGGGTNNINVNQTLTADKVRITDAGETTVFVFLGSAVTNNTLTVYSDENVARNTITLSWIDQTDLDKVRILVSKDSSFESYEFNLELYNQVKSFTLNLEQGYFIQFQANDEDGWEQRLLDDHVAPNQVTGLKFNGSVLSWDETHDDLSGNGVKQYHVEVSDDASFTNLIASEIVTGTQYAPATLAESTLYFRVSAEDYTNNIGAWSETVSGMFDNTPPSRPSGGNSTINGYSATLSWSASTDSGSGVAQYEYRIASDSTYGQIVTSGMTEACSITVDDLKYGTYYWQVRAVDAAGNESDWSLSKNFATVDSIAPITPANLDYGIEDGSTLSVIWDAVIDDALGSGLNRYEIQLANDADFATIVEDQSSTVPEVTIKDLGKGNYYMYMRVCAVDNAGNRSAWTDTESFIIDIDTTPPTITNIQSSITEPTNQNVIVTATFSDNVAVETAQYRIGKNGVWKDYKNGVTVTENTTVYFKAVDTSGNASAEVPFVVTNIDKTPPEKPTAAADITTPTRGSVIVTATFSEDSMIQEYSMDGQTWAEYTDPITFDTNGTVFFRGADAVGNVSEAVPYTVSNIDTVAPEKPVASADITTPTNQNVTVTATFSSDSYRKEYSLDGKVWMTYSAGVTMEDNGMVYFRGTDEAGNVSDVTDFLVSNIDRIAPEKPTASANITEVTRQNVQVSAVFSDDSVGREYSLDAGETWRVYTKPIWFTKNGSVSFRGTDEAGNVSKSTEYVVDNIISAPLDIPVISVDVTAPTNGTVTVSATFSEIVSVKQYSVDGQTWLDYDAPLTFTDNGFVVFLCIDASGECAYSAYAVTNIDKVAPEQPGAYATATAPTNRDVTVKAMFSNDTAKKEYSMDGTDWVTYTDGIVFEENGIIYFRGTDAAGNVSKTTMYIVTNIDKVAPEKPTVSADITEITSGPVTVSAAFSQDSIVREYSLDGENWVDYTESIEFRENGMSFFRGMDEAGNISSVANYAVEIIDTEPPTVSNITPSTTEPTLSVTITADFSDDVALDSSMYRLGAKGEWKDYPAQGVVVTENTTVYFKAIDKAGNESAVASYDVTNIASVTPTGSTKSDIDGNGISDVMFVWTGNTFAHGYWMNGKNDWWSANAYWVSPEWDNLGSYDMSGDGKADAVMFGNVTTEAGIKGAYIGYYQDGDDMNGWVTIGYLDNSENVAWQNKVGNLTGNASGANSIVWYTPDMYALGAWTDGTETWVGISEDFGGPAWTLAGCGDFDGDGKDSVLMMYNGCMFYSADIDGNVASLGNAAWYNCEVRAIGDFSCDGKDDIVLFDKNTGGMYMLLDGNADNYKSIGQLDPTDWFVAGCGDYNADGTDDLLVRQYSTGMLGYYSNGNQANWNVMGYGVDMDWTVIA